MPLNSELELELETSFKNRITTTPIGILATVYLNENFFKTLILTIKVRRL